MANFLKQQSNFASFEFRTKKHLFNMERNLMLLGFNFALQVIC